VDDHPVTFITGDSDMSLVTRFRALVLFVFVVTACCSLRAQPSEFRVVNLLPDSGPLDVFVGDSILPRALNLDYGSASASFTGVTGASFFVANPSGQHGQPMLSTVVSGIAGYRTDLLMLGSSISADLEPLPFSLASTAGPDSLYVRVFHAAGSLTSLDYTLVDARGGSHPMPGNSYKSVSNFIAVPRGPLEVNVWQSGVVKPIADVSANLAGGSYVTIFLVGDAANLRVLGLIENSQLLQQPMTNFLKVTPPPPASFQARLINLVDSIGSASIRLDDSTSAMAEGVAYRGASAVARAAVGVHTVTASSTGSQTRTLSLNFGTNFLYSMFWVGTKASHDLVVFNRLAALSTVAVDSVRIRILNAAPDLSTAYVNLIDAKTHFRSLPGIDYKAASSYLTLPAGRLIFRVGEGASYQGAAMLPGGTDVTLILSGSTLAGTLGVNILPENDSTAQAPMPAFEPLGNGGIRILNVVSSSAADSVTAYIDHLDGENSLVVHSMESGPIAEIPTTSFALDFALDGGGVAQSALSRLLLPASDTLTSIVVMKGTGGNRLMTVDLISTAADIPPAGNVSLRFMNASPDVGAVNVHLKLADGSTGDLSGPIGYGQASSFQTYPTGSVQATITRSGGSSSAVVEGNLDRPLVTAILTGMQSNGTLAVHLYDETSDPGENPMPTMTASAAVSEMVEAQATPLSLAPNPATSVLSVRCGSMPGGMLVVSDLLGREVKRLDLGEGGVSGRLSLDVADLAPGSYLLRLVGADGAAAGSGCFTVVR
jgi:hypothetical protein